MRFLVIAGRTNSRCRTTNSWELRLILLSGALDKSIDELVGNDIKYTLKEECGSNIKVIIKIYIALAFLCGTIAGIWSFSANRFRVGEMIFIIGAGMIIGLCLAVVCHNILKYLKKVNY